MLRFSSDIPEITKVILILQLIEDFVKLIYVKTLD